MKNRNGTCTVNPEIIYKFSEELDSYMKNLLRIASGELILGNPMPMPTHNLNDILKKYVELSVADLHKSGVSKVRGRSVSKYTLGKILENKVNVAS